MCEVVSLFHSLCIAWGIVWLYSNPARDCAVSLKNVLLLAILAGISKCLKGIAVSGSRWWMIFTALCPMKYNIRSIHLWNRGGLSAPEGLFSHASRLLLCSRSHIMLWQYQDKCHKMSFSVSRYCHSVKETERKFSPKANFKIKWHEISKDFNFRKGWYLNKLNN